MADDKFPPRGFGPEIGEKPPDQRWADSGRLSTRWDYSERKVLLGQWQGRPIGDPDAKHLPPGSGDNRHLVTIAGSRSGKSRDVLIPNLRRYRGSTIVIDPKGELAEATAATRKSFGEVFILDPFNVVTGDARTFRASFNPFFELRDSKPETIAADAALVADALIVPSGGDTHWTDATKNLFRGLILHLLSSDPGSATFSGMRRALTGNAAELIRLFDSMAANQTYGQTIANTGRGFKAKIDRGDLSPELRSIISTANEQTWPLEDVAAISNESDFYLSTLTAVPTTIYLVLPATRLATHAKWLRLIVNLTLAAIERNPVPDINEGGLPVWVILEEFAALGHMRSVERAAGFMAGMGCKLWVVLQDLTQLKTHYKESWETFLGNAGIIQAWSNLDVTTTEYLSKLIGNTTILEMNKDRTSASGQESGDDGRRLTLRTVPLLDPTEVTFHFARETGRQLILSPGRPPIFLERFDDGGV